MDSIIKSSRYKDIADNILEIEDDFKEKILKLYYKTPPADNSQVISIMKYLNATEYKNYKFNQYSVKKNDNFSIIIFSYTSPSMIFAN